MVGWGRGRGWWWNLLRKETSRRPELGGDYYEFLLNMLSVRNLETPMSDRQVEVEERSGLQAWTCRWRMKLYSMSSFKERAQREKRVGLRTKFV